MNLYQQAWEESPGFSQVPGHVNSRCYNQATDTPNTKSGVIFLLSGGVISCLQVTILWGITWINHRDLYCSDADAANSVTVKDCIMGFISTTQGLVDLALGIW